MTEETHDKLPLDAKLLSDAVIELNISRRSVGLYPPEHPIVRNSIERAFSHLQKLFEIRASITLGVAKDRLVIDDYTLDQKNPVFREFALSIHSKGIASVTFNTGLGKDELVSLHLLITGKEEFHIRELMELASKEMRHITLSPIDMSSFCFIEGADRSGAACGDLWDDYVYGLLEGRLADGSEDMIYAIPPENLAETVNSAVTGETGKEAYDRVITAYIRKKSESRMSSESLYKFFNFVERLKPEIKRQFLERAGTMISESDDDIESIVRDMTPDSFQKIADLFTENASIIPTTLKNLIDRLSSIKKAQTSYFDLLHEKSGIMDDIVLGEEIVKLFGEDNFRTYVTQEYQRELDRMLTAGISARNRSGFFRKDFAEDVTDRAVVEIMLELLHEETVEPSDYLAVISRIAEFMNAFIETGQFREILEAYNTIYTDTLESRFRDEATGIIEYFFHSGEFISRLIAAFRLWGRKDRENSFMLARALKRSVTPSLIDALSEEQDSSIRKFLLSMIEAIGSDVVQHAAARLNDSRWYVLRNMICIIRECNGTGEMDRIRKFARHQNAAVCLEAVRTLMHFGMHDALPFLMTCLQGREHDLRKGAIRLSGIYRVKEAVPYLLRYLEKTDIFGTESLEKLDLVKALNEIGDPSSVAVLQKIYSSRTIFYKGYMDELKTEIFRGLKHYPYEAVKDLIQQGHSSRNTEIRELCEKYLADNEAGAGGS